MEAKPLGWGRGCQKDVWMDERTDSLCSTGSHSYRAAAKKQSHSIFHHLPADKLGLMAHECYDLQSDDLLITLKTAYVMVAISIIVAILVFPVVWKYVPGTR